MTAGGSLRSYCYDANGNLTTISGADAGYTAVSWSASNLARRMSKGSTSAEFWYGPDRARVLQVVMQLVVGRATETLALSGVVSVAPAAEVAACFIPVVGTGVALFAVYVAFSDPNATTEDRANPLIGNVPIGKIAGLLAHSKVVLAVIKVAEKGGGKAVGGGASDNEYRGDAEWTGQCPVDP